MKRFSGLLCDLDGTLADTEPQHCAAWLTMLDEQLDLQYDEHWFEQWVGTSDRVVADWLINKHDLFLEVDDLILAKQAMFHDIVGREGKSFPGVPEALGEISGKYPLAIATNSGRSDTDVVIPALRLDVYTEIIVTATDVENLKPAPDIYLLAAERLGLPADRCIAIEDSGPGGEAAKAAGCYLIGLNERVTGADEVIGDNAAAIRRAGELLEIGSRS